MVKEKSPAGASASEVLNPRTAAMQCALDLLVSKAGGLKSHIDDVHCMAIETRIFLLNGDACQDRGRVRRVADELRSVIDEIETLVVALQSASAEAERDRLQ